MNPHIITAHFFRKPLPALAALACLLSVGVRDAHALTTASNFDGGGLDGWTPINLGGYSIVNSAGAVYISGNGFNAPYYPAGGIYKTFTVNQGSLHVALRFRAASYYGYQVTNAHFEVRDAATDVSLVHENLWYNPGLPTTDTGWLTYSKDVSQYVQGIASVKIVFGLADAWSADWGLRNWYDDIVVTTGDIPTPPADTTPPVVQLAAPPAYTNASTLVVSGSALDETAMLLVQVLVNGAATNVVPAADGALSATVSLAEGVNTLELRATDRGGNVASATAQVVRDTAPPSVEVDPVPQHTTAELVTISGRAHDNRGVASSELVVNGELVVSAALGLDGAFQQEVPLAEGWNVISVRATDIAGNTSATLVQVLRDAFTETSVSTFNDGSLDGWTPIGLGGFTVVNSGGAIHVYGDSFIAPYYPAGGIAKVFAITPGSLQVSLRFRAISTYGHQVTNARLEVRDALTDASLAVVPMWSHPESPITDTGWLNFSADLSQYVVGRSAVRIILALADAWVANWGLQNWYDDVVVGTGSGAQVADTIPPVVALDPTPQYTREETLEVSGVALDEVALADVRLFVNGASSGALVPELDGTVCAAVALSEGANTLVLEATDTSGNVSVASAEVVRDSILPVVTLAELPEYTAGAILDVAGTVHDSGGVAVTQLLVNGAVVASPPVLADGSVSAQLPLEEGPNLVVLVATDLAGNSAAASAEVWRDGVPPAVEITSPAHGQAFGSSSVSLSISVSDVTPVLVTVGGQSVAVDGGGVVAVTVDVPAEGYNTIEIVAEDAVGNSTVATVQVLVDFGAPILSTDLADAALFGPMPGDVLPFTLRVDDLGATTVTLSSGEVLSLDRGGGVVHALLPLSPGVSLVWAEVTDELGRTSRLTRTVTYDVTPPHGSFLWPLAGAAARGAAEISLQASDDLTGVGAVTFLVDGEARLGGAAGMDALYSAILDTTSLLDGKHSLAGVIVDGVGNTGTVSLTFVVDNTAPALVMTQPAAGSYVHGTVAIAASATDSTSGVAGITLSVNGVVVASCPGATCAASFDTTTLADGAFVVAAVATDVAGNIAAPEQVQLFADNARPERFLISPTQGWVATSAVTIAVDVNDPNFVEVECFLDGASLGRSSDARFSVEVSMLNHLDGSHGVTCVARDRAGNVGSESVTFVVRNWRAKMKPRALNLKGSGHGKAKMVLFGPNVSLLMDRGLALAVPGGSPVPVLGRKLKAARNNDGDHECKGDEGDDEDDADSGCKDARLTLWVERDALIASIRAGVAVGAIDPEEPLNVSVVTGGVAVAADAARIVAPKPDSRCHER